MTFREVSYKVAGIQFPTHEPLKSIEKAPALSAISLRQELFDTMIVNNNIVDLKGNILVPDIPQKVTDIANKIIANRSIYLPIAHFFSCPIQWFHIGCIHQMEGELNFNTYLGNGQSLSRVTTKVPKGRGPFKTFEQGAIDAIRQNGLNDVYDWGIGNTLLILEKYNGLGYSDYKGINSPYIFSGSNQYISGKYIADSVYSPTEVSQQIGIALILQKLISLGVTNY